MHKLLNTIIISLIIINKSLAQYNKEMDNILMLVVDDMRQVLCGGGDVEFNEHARIETPNMEALARKSIVFKNAFAQQALCAPSRNSFLTGRRPDTLHLYDFYNYWRTDVGNFTTIPQYFKDHGYKTYSFGKVFHPGISSNYTDDYPLSWSEPPFHPSTEIYKDEKVCKDENVGKLASNLICPVILKFQPEQTLPDIQIAEAAKNKLKKHKNDFANTPFFIAVGFHKPHIPLKFPREYLEFYPLSNISLPKQPFRPALLPNVAWNPWTDVRSRDDIRNLNISFPFGEMPNEWTLKIIQSYYAAITYVDDMIGKILKEIDMENTMIILTSDHGWSLGEHGEWAKYSNFDIALKVPLIIYTPKINIRDGPEYLDEIVELVDIFPTLAELSGITENFTECQNKEEILCSEGKSLKPLINKKNTIWKNVAFSQYPRPGNFPTLHPNSDKPKMKQIKIMGYSIRTKRYRYTEWVKFDYSTCLPDWNTVYGVELYDHFIDKGENLNLADRKELNFVKRKLSKKLHGGNEMFPPANDLKMERIKNQNDVFISVE